MQPVQTNEIYLDYAATTPVNPQVFDAYAQLVQSNFTNCDALYAPAVNLKKIQEQARNKIAQMLGFKNEEIIFVSGASEANNMIIKGFALTNKENSANKILVSSVEHSSVKESIAFVKEYYGTNVIEIPVSPEGLDMDFLRKHLDHSVGLVSIMAVNNETGMRFDIDRIADLVRQNSHAKLHVDAVQAIGKENIDFIHKVDALTISMHKLHGMKGVGILAKRGNFAIPALISAGQQEFGLRGGTSNACLNITCAKTLRLAIENQEQNRAHAKVLFDYAYNQFVNDPLFHINSSKEGSPFVFNVSSLTTTSQVLMNALNAKGIYCSATSTCESKQGASFVLKAMGFNEIVQTGSLRLSFSYEVSMEQLQKAIEIIKEVNQQYATR